MDDNIKQAPQDSVEVTWAQWLIEKLTGAIEVAAR
jgi:hypothetical protein